MDPKTIHEKNKAKHCRKQKGRGHSLQKMLRNKNFPVHELYQECK